MRKNQLISLAVVSLLIVTACTKVPVTGRNQLNMLPESQMVAMGLTSYSDFLKEHPAEPATNGDAQLVKRTGEKIKNSVIIYMRKNKMYDRISDYKWEFNLVNSKEVNAWCMPGGKVVVYSGLLPVTKDESSLALVMGHEIGHAIARHGNERMSQGLLAEFGSVALDVATMNKPAETRALFNTAYGAGATVGVLLPFSRLQETEADKLGLIFMAMAGYDPRTAPEFWKRMASLGGGKPPEFLSTHPSDETRIKNLKEFMPEALKYYKVK
jgi:predicted Zn-dependent protease